MREEARTSAEPTQRTLYPKSRLVRKYVGSVLEGEGGSSKARRRPLHITMTPIGSRGDVQPFVALGKGLQAEGHVVRLATHDIHTDLVTSHGLEFAPIEGNPREMFETLTGQAWLDSGRNILKFWWEFRKLAEKTVEKSLADAKEACLGTDAILFTFLGAAGFHMAEMLGVPRMMGLLQPFSRTREFPYCVMPELPLGGAYNKSTYRFAEQLS